MLIAGEIKRIEDWYAKAGPKDKTYNGKMGIVLTNTKKSKSKIGY